MKSSCCEFFSLYFEIKSNNNKYNVAMDPPVLRLTSQRSQK